MPNLSPVTGKPVSRFPTVSCSGWLHGIIGNRQTIDPGSLETFYDLNRVPFFENGRNSFKYNLIAGS